MTRKAQITLTDLGPTLPVPVEMLRPRIEPVMVEIVRECHFKAKTCGLCDLPKSNPVHTPKETATCPFKRRNGCATCGRPKGDRSHMGEPPSLNVLGSGDPRIYMSLKDRWQRLLVDLLSATDLPRGLAHVLAEGEVTFPTRGRRDQGNSRVIVEKALGDALVEGRWLADDDWTSYEFGNLVASYEKGVSATRLMLFPTLPE